MAIVETLDDLERLIKMMGENEISDISVDGIAIKSRGKFPETPKQRSITDEEILMNPYAGLNG